jgi:hypothetical protein
MSNWFAQMFGGKPQNVMVNPERRSPGWTTPEELATAKQYDMSYGDPSAGFFQPGAKMRMPGSLPEMLSAFNNSSLGSLPNQPIDAEMADRLYSAWLATRSSPLAALGFDPRAMISAPSKMTENRDLTLGGTYSSKRDEIFATGKYDSTFAHESIHRGIAKLRNAGLLPKVAGGYNEEMLTRAFMLKYYGNIEEGRGSIGDSEVRMGRSTLENKFNRHMLDELEQAAADYIAKQRPRGPR